MPTYKSNSNEIENVAGVNFAPGKEVKLNTYINLNNYSFLIKVSDEPAIRMNSTLVFENINDTTNMSQIYTLDNKKILEVKDGENSNQNDDYIEIRIFMGHTDNQVEFVPYNDVLKFKRITQADVNGVIYPYWYPVKDEATRDFEKNLIPAVHFPVTYPFFSIAIVNTSFNGNVNVYLRDVRQITQLMI